MAIQDKTLSGAEHDFFVTGSGLDPEAPLTEHKSKYFSDKGFGSNASISKPLTQMEREWLQSVASSASNNEGDLWREACAAASVPVTQSTSQNKLHYYTGVDPNA